MLMDLFCIGYMNWIHLLNTGKMPDNIKTSSSEMSVCSLYNQVCVCFVGVFVYITDNPGR